MREQWFLTLWKVKSLAGKTFQTRSWLARANIWHCSYSHSRISWLQSSNSRVGISRETSPRILHPLLLSASAWVASSESQTSATLHLSVTVYTQTYDELAAAYHVSRAGNMVYLLSWKTIQHQLVPNIAKVYSLSQNNTQFEGNSHV